MDIKNHSLLTYSDYLKELKAAPETELQDFDCYLREHPMLEGFLKMNSHVVYLLNYTSRHYLYLSPNTESLSGLPLDAFREGGIEYYMSKQHPDDLRVFNKEVFPNNLAFFENVPPLEYDQYRISHTIRVQKKDGTWIEALQKNRFIKSNAEGNPIVSFGTVCDISPYKQDHNIVHRIDRLQASGGYQNVMNNLYFLEEEAERLTKREVELLKWILEGLSSKVIADKLNLSLHTVKTHRRNMLEKTNSKNTPELIRYAITNQLV